MGHTSAADELHHVFVDLSGVDLAECVCAWRFGESTAAQVR